MSIDRALLRSVHVGLKCDLVGRCQQMFSLLCVLALLVWFSVSFWLKVSLVCLMKAMTPPTGCISRFDFDAVRASFVDRFPIQPFFVVVGIPVFVFVLHVAARPADHLYIYMVL